MEDSKSVPAGSPVGQNEPSVPVGYHTQPREPIGDKNGITSMTLEKGGYAGVGNYRGKVVMLWWPGNHREKERSRVCEQ
jgi:hypothetical protein